MSLLPENEDDQYLDAGQIAEERIGSIDWQYRYCKTCGESRLIKKGSWFSAYSSCGSCGYKTMSQSETTISAASYSSSGLARVTETCKHCDHQRSWTRTIPQLQQSSSSSSSGGFGGGSSSGGGSGSSW